MKGGACRHWHMCMHSVRDSDHTNYSNFGERRFAPPRASSTVVHRGGRRHEVRLNVGGVHGLHAVARSQQGLRWIFRTHARPSWPPRASKRTRCWPVASLSAGGLNLGGRGPLLADRARARRRCRRHPRRKYSCRRNGWLRRRRRRPVVWLQHARAASTARSTPQRLSTASRVESRCRTQRSWSTAMRSRCAAHPPRTRFFSARP